MKTTYQTSLIATATLLSLGVSSLALAATPVAPLTEVTLYSQGTSLVKETKTLTLGAGTTQTDWAMLPTETDASSIFIRFPKTTSPVNLLEQTFKTNWLDSNTLLQASMGQSVLMLDPLADKHATPPKPKYISVTLKKLIGSYALVELPTSKQTIIVQQSDILPRTLPTTLKTDPTLQLTLKSDKPQTAEAQLLYLTNGLGWTPNYVATLNPNETIDLQAWVTLTNNTAKRFENTKLHLVAGELRRQNTNEYQSRGMMKTFAAPQAVGMAMADGASFETASHEQLGDLYLYELPHLVTLNPNETKQVGLFQVNSLPVKLRYVYNPNPGYQWYGYTDTRSDAVTQAKTPVSTYLKLTNPSTGGVGQSLPAGLVRFYQADSKQRLQLVGEENIPHTPVGEFATVELGKAFDVLARKTQTKWHSTPNYQEANYEVILTNRKTLAASVEVYENPQGDWELTKESAKPENSKVAPLKFVIAVPANGETKLTYTIRNWVKR